ncbi:MAG: pyocin knob domain-containing protein [Aeromonas veronii]
MPNNYYERLSEMNPGELADGLAMEQEFDAIGRGFSKLPDPHRDGRGFEGPTRVGDPVEKSDAVNLWSLEKLNLPIYRKKITTEDWNSITEGGLYDVVNSSGLNSPPTYKYGILHVYLFNGVVTQVFYPDKNDLGVLAKRTCQNISIGNWTAWAVLNSVKAICIVNAVGTGANNEIIDSNLPVKLSSNSRYVLTNPFGINIPVVCIAEVKADNGKWASAGWIYDANGSTGVSVSYVQGEGIVIQTGTYGVHNNSNVMGTAHNNNDGRYTNMPCRIFVYGIL